MTDNPLSRPMNRRDFLKVMGTLTAAGVILPAVAPLETLAEAVAPAPDIFIPEYTKVIVQTTQAPVAAPLAPDIVIEEPWSIDISMFHGMGSMVVARDYWNEYDIKPPRIEAYVRTAWDPGLADTLKGAFYGMEPRWFEFRLRDLRFQTLGYVTQLSVPAPGFRGTGIAFTVKATQGAIQQVVD
jgi:hypothetical protein